MQPTAYGTRDRRFLKLSYTARLRRRLMGMTFDSLCPLHQTSDGHQPNTHTAMLLMFADLSNFVLRLLEVAATHRRQPDIEQSYGRQDE